MIGGNEWAKKTLDDHRQDKRDYLYSKKDLEDGKTSDRLWNAAQVMLARPVLLIVLPFCLTSKFLILLVTNGN